MIGIANPWRIGAIAAGALLAVSVAGVGIQSLRLSAATDRAKAAESARDLAASQRDAAVAANHDLRAQVAEQSTAVRAFTDHAQVAQQVAAEALRQARAANQASQIVVGRLDVIAADAARAPAADQCAILVSTIEQYMRGALR